MNYLKLNRKRLNLTQNDVAGFCGIKQSRISNLEKLNDNILFASLSVKELARLAELFAFRDGETLERVLLDTFNTVNQLEPFNMLEL